MPLVERPGSIITTRFGTVFICGLIAALDLSGGAGSQTLSTYGTPGLIDMPTAQVLPDGYVALTTSHFGANQRNTLTFQVLPRVYGSFR